MARRGGLGDILVEERLIAREQLNQAKRAAERIGTPLAAVLLDQGLVNEDSLVAALRKRVRLEFFDPAEAIVELDAVRSVPFEEADRYRLLPVQTVQRGSHQVLRIAMVDPLDAQAIEDIEYSTGCMVEPLIAKPSQLAEAIRNHYRGITTRVIPRHRSGADLDKTPVHEPKRAVFGGGLNERHLRTRPILGVHKVATPAQKVDALVSALVRRGVITLDDYEEQLTALVDPHPEEEP